MSTSPHHPAGRAMTNSVTSVLAFFVSLLALTLSAVTAWVTLLRRGEIRMTRPTVVYFGPDSGTDVKGAPEKVFLRTLLYSTGKRGHILENMFVRLHRGETRQNFNVWAYGDKDLSRGSGLFIPETGFAANHHFLLPPDGTYFRFSSGIYTLEVFVAEVGVAQPRCLYRLDLEIPITIFEEFDRPGHGLYFDWGPDAGRYFAHVRHRLRQSFQPFFERCLAKQRSKAASIEQRFKPLRGWHTPRSSRTHTPPPRPAMPPPPPRRPGRTTLYARG